MRTQAKNINKMKKTSFLVMALAALCLFAACSEKEGVYNPKKKIANIYKSGVTIHSSLDESTGLWYSDTVTVAKYLSEAWTWDGKKLTKVTFYEQNASNEVEDVINFSYDGKQMVRAEGDGDYMTFSYNGKELKSCAMYDKENTAAPIAQFDFVYKDGKVVEIKVTGEGIELDKVSARRLEQVVFREILPTFEQADMAIAKISNTMRTNGAKAGMTIPVKLTWDGDNVSKMETSMTMMGMTMNAEVSFTYDNKNNPYQHFLFGMFGMLEDASTAAFNKNNVVKAVSKETFMGETSVSEMNYTYTYDGSWPTSQTMTNTINEENYKVNSTSTNYFEYK